ncbi:hypothetical protein K439DRAFT_946713 [Ramaria rubella]|nr:hypothetical protein K439DRAFT_946713 [Ramaria rubella]
MYYLIITHVAHCSFAAHVREHILHFCFNKTTALFSSYETQYCIPLHSFLPIWDSIGHEVLRWNRVRFLQQSGLKLPIPRLVDSIVADSNTYAIMTRIPGQDLLTAFPDLSEDELCNVAHDVLAVLHELWKIKQPLGESGKIIMNASGHGVPNPATFRASRVGPFNSTLECYGYMSDYGTLQALRSNTPESVLQALAEDDVVWVHPDLKMWKIFVKNGQLSGIVDWEDSGWYPRHWQIAVLHFPCRGSFGLWNKFWRETRFDGRSEAAWVACKSCLTYPL